MYDRPPEEQPVCLWPDIEIVESPVSIVARNMAPAVKRLSNSEFRSAHSLFNSELQRLYDQTGQLKELVSSKTSTEWLVSRTLQMELRKYKDCFDQVVQKIDKVNDAAGKPVDTPKAEANLKRELLLLLQRGAEFDNDGISLVTEREVILEEPSLKESVNFGFLRMQIRWTAIGSSPYDDNWIRVYHDDGGDVHGDPDKPEACHPHVWDDGRVCLGREGDDGPFVSIRQALLNGDLMFVFDLLEATLYTYNQSSPIRPLREWVLGINAENNYMCEICETYDIGEDDIRCCEPCGRHVCEDCSSYSDIDEQTLCDRCIVARCDGCEEAMSERTERLYCSSCERERCYSCYETSDCTACDCCDSDVCGDGTYPDPLEEFSNLCCDCNEDRQQERNEENATPESV